MDNVFFIMSVIAVTAFFIGSLPISKWAVYALTLGGKFYDVRYVAFIRVCSDITKGAATVAMGHEGGMDGAHLAAVAVYFGHIFPLGAGFGKQNGTGTLLGALILLNPLVGLTALSSWMFAFYVYRHATLSAVISAGLTTLICGFIGQTPNVRVEVLVLMTVMVFWRHRRYILFHL